MTAQPSLFDDLSARARRSDPLTSHRAAASVEGIRESQAAVLRCFVEQGPMHDELLQKRYDQRPPQSESGLRTRRHELEELGLLRDSGKTATTRNGRATVVWELTDAGHEAAT